MNTSNVEEIFDLIGSEESEFNRNLIFSILMSNLGASFEKVHDAENAIAIWENLGHILTKLIDLSKEGALEIAVKFITLPRHENPNIEFKYRYLRGAGLGLLGDERLTILLSKFLKSKNEESNLLYGTIICFIQNPEIENWNREKALSTPEFYFMVASLKIGILLAETSSSFKIQGLSEIVKAKLLSPLTVEQIRWYHDVSDTKDLAAFMEKYLTF